MLDYSFISSLFVLVVISVFGWVQLFLRIRSKPAAAQSWLDRALPRRLRIESPIGAVDVITLFVFWFLMQAISLALFGPTGQESSLAETPDALTQTMLAIAGGQLVGTLCGLAFIGLRHGHAPRIFGWQPEHFRSDSRLGLVLFSMTIPPLLLLQWGLSELIEYHHQTLELLRDQATGTTLLVTWLSAGLIAPITEEIFFRGVLQAWLQRLARGMSQVGWLLAIGGGFAGKYLKPDGHDDSARTGTAAEIGMAADEPRRVLADSDSVWGPILISSAAFGMVHLGQGLAPVTLFAFGLVLGIIYRQTGSLWPCILLHMLLNAFSLFWVTLEVWLGPTVEAFESGRIFHLTIGSL